MTDKEIESYFALILTIFGISLFGMLFGSDSCFGFQHFLGYDQYFTIKGVSVSFYKSSNYLVNRPINYIGYVFLFISFLITLKIALTKKCPMILKRIDNFSFINLLLVNLVVIEITILPYAFEAFIIFLLGILIFYTFLKIYKKIENSFNKACKGDKNESKIN